MDNLRIHEAELEDLCLNIFWKHYHLCLIIVWNSRFLFCSQSDFFLKQDDVSGRRLTIFDDNLNNGIVYQW